MKLFLKLMVRIVIFASLTSCAVYSPGVYKNSPPLGVQAVGYGTTRNIALKEAFRDAIQKSVGVLISSQSSVTDGMITKDLMSEFSDGYIDNYQEVSLIKTPEGLYQITIFASVSSSKLINKMKLISQTATYNSQNKLMYAQLSTIDNARKLGDALLLSTVDLYPRSAFKINIGKIKTLYDDNRRSYMVVPFDLTWNTNFLDLFEMDINFVGNNCALLLSPKFATCNYNIRINKGLLSSSSHTGYELVDMTHKNIIFSRMRPDIGLMFGFYDKTSKLLESVCVPIDISEVRYSSFGMIETRNGVLHIKDLTFSSEAKIGIGDIEFIPNYAVVTATPVRSCNPWN